MALVQLMAKGVQDTYLTSNPQYSLFKTAHRRHTAFAQQWSEETFAGEAMYGKRCVVELNKSSDLVHNIILEATMKRTGDTFYPLEELLQMVELYIGGVKVSHYDNTWIRLYDELFRNLEEQMAYREMCDFTSEPIGNTKTLRIPLLFFFNRAISQSLPLISLAYSTVELVFHFASSIKGVDMSVDPKFKIHVERIFLDNDERAIFAKSKHSYLIEQLQMHRTSTLDIRSSANAQLLKVNLPFNHPCKSIVFVFKDENQHGVFSSSLLPFENREAYGILRSAKIVIDGNERQEDRSGSWLRNVENYLRMNTTPSVGVYCFHYAMHPEDSVNPSGSINLSQFETELLLRVKQTSAATVDDVVDIEEETVEDARHLNYLHIYATNWNVLHIEKGMAGVKWSN
jgi:hypothetical protein